MVSKFLTTLHSASFKDLLNISKTLFSILAYFISPEFASTFFQKIIKKRIMLRVLLLVVVVFLNHYQFHVEYQEKKRKEKVEL